MGSLAIAAQGVVELIDLLNALLYLDGARAPTEDVVLVQVLEPIAEKQAEDSAVHVALLLLLNLTALALLLGAANLSAQPPRDSRDAEHRDLGQELPY